MRILGIDPGTTRVGYGVIEKEKGKLTYITHGVFGNVSFTQSERLLFIEKELSALLKKEHPDHVSLERLFFSKNKKTALQVAEARGVIIVTILKFGIPIVELTPNEVKSAVTGNGNASKHAIQKMVSLLLQKDFSRVLDDATDALALAISASYPVSPLHR